MGNVEFLEKLKKEYEASFTGWDFSHLTQSARVVDCDLPWNYKNIVDEYIGKVESMLDMDTGGGEFLNSFSRLPVKTVATEGYLPNFEISSSRLDQRGVTVVKIENDNLLPFPDNSFELIINRHSAYVSENVTRVLKTNGYFITQQVGSLNNIELNLFLDAECIIKKEWSLFNSIEDFEKAGLFIVEYNDNIGKTRFKDIGSIVYYLKCVPWQINGFSVEKYIDRLEKLDYLIKKNGFFETTNHRYYIVARRGV